MPTTAFPVASRPDDVGFSQERLQVLDRTLKEYIDSQRRTGFNAMVIRHGQIAFQKSYGHRRRGGPEPMTSDTLFRMFSMTKIVTAVAALILWEEGRFQLDDPLEKHLPAFADPQVMVRKTKTQHELIPARRSIVVRDLFLHTAGLAYVFPYHPQIDQMVYSLGLGTQKSPEFAEKEFSLKEYVEKIAELPLIFHPGETWHYSFATDVLAGLVEAVAGVPYAQFLDERIFTPLQMNDTSFSVKEQDLSRVSSLAFAPGMLPPEAYEQMEIDQWGVGHVVDVKADPFIGPDMPARGGMGLISTIDDYARFFQCLLQGGHWHGQRILGRKTVEFATANQMSPDQMPFEAQTAAAANPHCRGFGFFGEVALEAAQKGWTMGSDGEYHWSGYAGTWFSVDPKENMILMIFTQYASEADRLAIWHHLRNGAYQALID